MKYKASASSMWAFAGTSSVTQSKSREINTCGFETAKSLLCMHMCMITRPRKTLRCFFFKGIKVNALNCKCFGTFDSELFKYSKEKKEKEILCWKSLVQIGYTSWLVHFPYRPRENFGGMEHQ